MAPRLLYLMLLAGCAHGQLELVELTSPAGPRCATPDLTRGADGTMRMTWVEHGESERSGRLMLAAWDGAGWGEPLEIARGDDWFLNWADFPSVCTLVDGTLIAHWLEMNGEETYSYGVRVRASTDGGASWSEPRVLHEDRSPTEHGFVSFAPLDESRFAAVWLDGRDGGGHGEGATTLYLRTVQVQRTAEGVPSIAFGPEIPLDRRVCDCCSTALVPSGPRRVTYAYRDRSRDEVRDISWGRYRFDGDLNVMSKPQDVFPDLWRIEGCPVNGPRLAATSEGRLAAAWFSGAGAGAGSVRVSFTEDDERGFGVPVDVDDGSPEGRVDAVFLEDGSLLVSWLEHVQSGAEWRVRRVAGDGAEMGDSLVVAEVPSGRASGFLRMVADGGGAVLAWTEPGGGSRVLVGRVVVR